MRELWMVTGLSGAGKSLALKCLEDLGFWCVDNLPAALMKPYLELDENRVEGSHSLRALGLRGIEQLQELEDALSAIPEIPLHPRLIFLECDENVLVKRYSESRRRHPLVDSGRGLLNALQDEREALGSLRQRADYVIDTTALSPHTLMTRLESILAQLSGQTQPLLVHLQSFGFKNGIPQDAEWVWDMRFLPNPYYDPDLRALSGLDGRVREVVFHLPEETRRVERLVGGLMEILPTYSEQGRRQVNIAVGCTGGQHRSVATVEMLGEILSERGYCISVHHRDARLQDESLRSHQAAPHNVGQDARISRGEALC